MGMYKNSAGPYKYIPDLSESQYPRLSRVELLCPFSLWLFTLGPAEVQIDIVYIYRSM
jgi:hypothetical protein